MDPRPPMRHAAQHATSVPTAPGGRAASKGGPLSVAVAVLVLLAAPAVAQIGVAKDATLSGREVSLDFYLENFGASMLNPVVLLDDLDATFGAGNYTVTSAPVFIVDPGTLVLNGSYDGSSSTAIVSDGSLAVGATARIRVVVELDAVTDHGFGVGIYFNQATAEANEGSLSDLSDDGTDPDPNGNGDPTESGENDPTRIDFTEDPTIGVAKQATVSGTEATFDVYLENLGNRELSNLDLPDDLDAVFGAGNYAVISGPTLVVDPGTLTPNAGFDGGADTALIASGTLAAGATAQLRVTIDVTNVTDRGSGLGVYSNQVTVSGTSPSGTPASDLSDAGIDPDPNGDGSPADPGEDDPTIFVIGESPVLGVAKEATALESDVTLDYVLENLGDVELVTLALAEDLDAVFGAGNYGVTSGPALVVDPGTITVNPLFDGSAETALIDTGTLAVGATAQIRVVVHVFALVDQGSGLGVYQNQVTAVGTSGAGAVTTDLSDDGTDPDPNGNGDPTDAGEDDPTTFTVAEVASIGLAKQVQVLSAISDTIDVGGMTQMGAGPRVVITWFLENLGNVTLSSVTLDDDLDAVFGAGNYGTVVDNALPELLLAGGGTISANTSYNGSTQTNVLTPGGTLAPRALATITTTVIVTNVTDQGLGVGVYENQATAAGQGPSAAMTSDLSDAGAVPDPNENGDAGDAGEDDPTLFFVSSRIGAAKSASVSGNEVTLDFYLENLGTVGLTDVSLTDNLDGVFGAGNYFVSAAPSLIDDPGTLAGNGGFDGSSDVELIAPGGSLAAGDTAQIRVAVTVVDLVNRGDGLGVFTNQALAAAQQPSGAVVLDASDAGTDPDPNGDGDPASAGEDDPTTFTVSSDAVVGAAKTASVAGTQVTFDLYLENLGTATATGLSLVDELDAVFGAGNYTLDSAPALIDDPGTLVLNGAFDGSTDSELLGAGSTLAAADTAQIQFVVDVTTVSDRGLGNGVYTNQAAVTATDSAGLVVRDLSDAGTDPDSVVADGDPTFAPLPPVDGEDDPTLFYIGQPVLGAALKAYVQGTVITLDYIFENLGDVPVQGITVQHPLNPVFGGGNYSVNAQPVQLDGDGTLVPSPQFFGFNIFDRLILDGNLGVGESARARVVIEVTNVTDQGNGLGVYETQITANAFAPDGVTPVSDLSDDGILTDPNGNLDPTETGENDPTLMIIGAEATLGVAKNASVSGSEVTLDYLVENLGNVTIDGLSMTDDLDAVFGAGNYTVTGVSSNPMGLGNPSFDGSSDRELFGAGATVAAGATAAIQVTVDVGNVTDRGQGLGVYTNQVIVSGAGPSASVAQDLSDAGTDPDPNGNGNPADVGEGDATTFVVTDAVVGVAKSASVVGAVVTLDYFVENLGTVPLTDVALSDDLDAVFGAGNYVVAGGPVIVGEPRELVPNASFDGSSVTALIASGGLQLGVLEQIRVVVQVTAVSDRGSGLGVYTNQVTCTALDPGMGLLSDLSDAGTDPDPNGNGDPGDAGENDPTPFTLVEDPTVGVAKTASVDGLTVTVDLFLESLGNVDATSVALVDDLDAVFGAGNYAVSSAPALISGPGTLVLNAGYDGGADPDLLAAGSSLALAAAAQIRFVVEVTTVTDQGSGLGVYANQATVTAAGSGGTMASDLSDEGSDPDPVADGDPGGAGEDDPTAIVLSDSEPPTVTDIGTSSGPLAECDTLRQPVTSLQLTVTDDLTPIVGADADSSYLLVGAGPDADLSTAACGVPAGDDIEIEIVSLSLTSTEPAIVELGLPAAGLEAGLYRFIVCDAISDTFGNALDGDGDGSPGGDFVLSFFRADPGNLFVNGHFDDCPATLDPWTPTALAPSAIQPGVAGIDDVDGSPFSASARVLQAGFDASAIAQCAPIASSIDHTVRSQLRFEPPGSALASFGLTCEFFDAASCAGSSLGSAAITSLLEDEGGSWIEVGGALAPPAGTASARCIFAVSPLGGDPSFDLFLDGIFLGVEGAIFGDGFESGDTSRWSLAVP